ncbi:MAG: hypothetical protein IID45_11600 [Planctomycetes bacterium]|nr:hypothetical protein [Planctomycetota bacterium]
MRSAFTCIVVLFALSVPALSFSADEKPAKPKNVKRQGPFPGLLAAVKKSPGCLGVESAVTASRKNVLFVWFKDKKSAIAWYNSKYHQTILAKFFPKAAVRRSPLKNVPDNAGPILAIASFTFSDKPKVKGTKLPMSQIAIELYAPLQGGLAIGGTFAPKGVKAATTRAGRKR